MIDKENETNRIGKISLSDDRQSPLSAALKKEQDKALHNLPRTAHLFAPLGDDTPPGPYDLTIGIEDGYLVIRLQTPDGQILPTLALSLTPYKRLIHDYFLMIDSYEIARAAGQYGKLEAIDMGRRGLHNEGADLIRARLKDKITMDHETARKLFTLICTLHKAHRHGIR